MCGCRRLFLDDAHVESRQGLIRSFHQAEKYPGNPVVVPDLPWERAMGHNHGTVLFEEGRFRYWYQTYAFAREAAGTFHCAYAESTDGIRWEKPLLGRHALDGDRQNNVVAYDVGGVNIVHDDHDGDPDRRYKMLYWGSGAAKPGAIGGWMGSAGSWGWCAASSPDGLDWRPHPHNPIYLAAADDGSFLGYDPTEQAYVAYLRPVTWKPGQRAMEPDTYDATIGSLHGWYEGHPAPVDEGMRRFPHMRLIGRATSADFVQWTPTGTVMVPDEDDPDGVELYSMPVFIYQGWYLGLLYVLYGDPDEPRIRKKGFMDIQLAASRDGITWRRIGGHRPLIPRGSRGEFDAGMVGPNNGLVERDGRIWLYYNGWTGEHRETKAYRRANDPGLLEMGRLGCGTGLAWLRQDGFISVDAGEDEGILTTKPERLGGMRLFVNARTAGPGGTLMVEVLPGNGNASDTVLARGAFRGDSVDAEVGGGELPRLPSGEYRLRFRLRSGSLYSYRLAAGA